jgi:hypothetical protein
MDNSNDNDKIIVNKEFEAEILKELLKDKEALNKRSAFLLQCKPL